MTRKAIIFGQVVPVYTRETSTCASVHLGENWRHFCLLFRGLYLIVNKVKNCPWSCVKLWPCDSVHLLFLPLEEREWLMKLRGHQLFKLHRFTSLAVRDLCLVTSLVSTCFLLLYQWNHWGRPCSSGLWWWSAGRPIVALFCLLLGELAYFGNGD